MRFAAAIFATAAATATVTITASNCGAESDKATFKNIETSPSPIQLGGPFTIKGNGALKEKVTDGKYEVKVTGPLGIKLLDHEDTICGATSFNLPLGLGKFDVSGIACPHESGDVTITQQGSLPAHIPAKEAKINLVTKDQDGNELMCVNFDMKINSSLLDAQPEMKSVFETLRAQHAAEQELTEEELEHWYRNWQMHVQEESAKLAQNAPLDEHLLAALLRDEFLPARPALTRAFVERLRGQAPFEAELSPRFHGWSHKMLKQLMGSAVGAEHMDLPRRDALEVTAELPEAFDARDKWGSKCPTIAHIRDQSTCGSCWAFGSTEAFNDRMCIASDGKFTTELSAQHTTSCCGFLQCFSNGCNGGQPGRAWDWLVKNGVVTGGDYGDKETCWPYEMPECAHHVESKTLKPCDGEKPTPSCRRSCSVGGQDFTKVTTSGKAYSLGSVDEIKQSLMDKGPVTAAFTVYEDFPTYKSGVYKHTSGSALGGHAIKIVGWGKDAEAGEYWIVNNSWNDSWGDKGTFKIAFGECGIEDTVSAGDVDGPAAAAVAQLVI